MALTTCRECGGSVSSSAGACPHCGAPVLKPARNWIKALIVVGALVVIAQCVSSPGTPTKPKGQRMSDSDCMRDLQCWSDKHKVNAAVRCTRAIERQLRFGHEWTDGVMNPRFPRIGWKNPTEGHMTFFGDQLRVQNAFGAMQKAEYACVYNPTTDTALQAVIELR
jgi:RNA polymerase subunit RPABC4/transcription elongation factor Spt4